MLVSNACNFHGGCVTFFSHGDMNSSAHYSSSTASTSGIGSSFLYRKQGIKRGWSAWELKQYRIPLTAPRSSLKGLPGSFNIGPEIQNLTEKILSQNYDYIDRLSPVWKTLRDSASLLENTAAMLAQIANKLPTLLLQERKEVDNTQAAKLVSTISSHLWHEVSSLSTSPSVQHLNHSAAMLLQRVELLSEQLGSRVSRFVTETPMDASTLSRSAEKLSISVAQMMVQIGTALGVFYGTLTTELAPASTTVLATVVASALILASTRDSARRGGFVEGEDLPLRYNPDAVAAYFNKRSLDIISRSSQIVFECSTFAASLLIDKSLAVGKDNEKMRAVQLITNLGPTAIKIGQALSIRPDILPVAYLEELQKLQDRVPPFSNDEAQQLILDGLGKPAEEVFSEISAEPIAAASLGQKVSSMSDEIKKMRAQLEEDEQVASLMRGLRGQNLSDELFASSDVQLRLVEVQEGEDDILPQVYDPDTIAAYWGKRPGAVFTRIAQLLAVAGGFLSHIAWDIVSKKVKENEVARAIELRDIVTSLGPAYIKLGQALSIRPDILSPAAMTELQKLCDKVPSFPSDVAMKLIEEELRQHWSEIYSELSPSPIAAASLGQVYKGCLKETGDMVAVKVQRPFVLETVTVDLFIIRKLGIALRKFPQIATDLVGLVDEWAARFFEELDYINEGQNGTRFAEMMREDLPQVVVPKTYSQYTSRRVLTTQWIEGEKLSQSTASDVGDLVNVGVICYLKQLLDTGFFHADPHPGNLIRTPDGKLAILDFGLMTQITDNQKYGMIDAISHLIHRDYDAIVKDFVMLDFIPEGVNLKPIMPVLAKVFDQALEGGGAKNINFQELAADLAQITFDYPFRIPPYFALVIRAVGVLEGIALVGNPEFAIVDEAYPYIAQRLLTDNSPRLREALRYTIYGKSGIFDAERFIDVMEAFETFITAAKSGGGDQMQGNMASLGLVAFQSTRAFPAPWMPQSQMQQQQVQMRAALSFLLSQQGEFFREFILDEVVKGIDAISREQLSGLVVSFGLDRLAPSLNTMPIFGFLRPVSLLPSVTEEDEIVLNNVRRVVSFLTAGKPPSKSLTQGEGGLDVFEVTREILPVLPNVATEMLPEIANRLTSRMVARFLREVFLV